MSEARASREQLLSSAFVALADTLVDDYDIIDLLDRLVGYSVDLLAADAAGVLLADGRGDLRTVASTNEQTEWMELQAADGPCVECFHTGAPVSIVDLDDVDDVATRWPRLLATVRDRAAAFRSVHALPLRLRGEAIGTLNLFDSTPGRMPAVDLALGQALADVATIGILQERAIRRGEVLSGQLQLALNNRVVIEQAKGVLAERGQLGMDAAFDRLRRYARSRSRPLSDVAREVVTANLAAEVIAEPAGRAARSDRAR